MLTLATRTMIRPTASTRGLLIPPFHVMEKARSLRLRPGQEGVQLGGVGLGADEGPREDLPGRRRPVMGGVGAAVRHPLEHGDRILRGHGGHGGPSAHRAEVGPDRTLWLFLIF